jgi:adenosine deaminase
VFERMQDHNLKRLLDQGLCITINSDDPAYFGGYLLENYTATQSALDLQPEDIVLLAKNSFAASFLPDAQKQTWMSRIDAYAASHV